MEKQKEREAAKAEKERIKKEEKVRVQLNFNRSVWIFNCKRLSHGTKGCQKGPPKMGGNLKQFRRHLAENEELIVQKY